MKNEPPFKELMGRILKNSFLFTILLFGLHKYFQYFFFKDVELYHPIYSIYLFLFLSLASMFFFIIKAALNKPETIFTTFAVGSLAKTGVSVLFFLPLFFNETPNINYTVFNFFIPYFLFLFFEIYQIIKLFNRIK